jgi:predicted phosphodiesterase
MSGITWIHLSDWHQQGKDFDRKVVRDALIDDIRKRNEISLDLERVDFIIFSGDMAYYGRDEEYETAFSEFIDQLSKASAVERDRFFIVPGNHDLDWNKLKEVPEELIKSLTDFQDINNHLSNELERKLLLKPFNSYVEFIRRHFKKYPSINGEMGYAYTTSFNADGKRVAVMGLNSAWLSGRNKNAEGRIDDYGKLILAESQVYELLNKTFTDADVRIAAMHHPFEWLVDCQERDRAEKLLCENCQFLLFGHRHLGQVKLWAGHWGNAFLSRRQPVMTGAIIGMAIISCIWILIAGRGLCICGVTMATGDGLRIR